MLPQTTVTNQPALRHILSYKRIRIFGDTLRLKIGYIEYRQAIVRITLQGRKKS